MVIEDRVRLKIIIIFLLKFLEGEVVINERKFLFGGIFLEFWIRGFGMVIRYIICEKKLLVFYFLLKLNVWFLEV